jgi:hypothetical protein
MSEAELQHFFRLSDTRLLLVYNNRAVIATVNFTSRTLTFGTPSTWQSGSTLPETFGLVQDFNENPARAAVACMQRSGNLILAGGFSADPSATAPAVISSYTFPAAQTAILSNIAGAANSSALVITGNSSNAFASLLNYSGAAAALTAQITLPITNASTINPIGLFCHNKSGGRFVYIYRQASNIFCLPVIVTGNTVTTGTIQTAGTETNTLTGAMWSHSSAGTDRFAVTERIILTGNTAGSVQGPLRMQALRVNASGLLTRGAIIDTPLMNWGGQPGMVTLTYKNNSNSVIYITGVDFETNPRDACLLEYEIENTTFILPKKYRPFQNLRITDHSFFNALRNFAFENPNTPGDFLFMQQWNQSPLPHLGCWYGNRNDNFSPNHIIGIAIEHPASGRIRVQTSAKYLPGIFNGLRAGMLYVPGINGALVPLAGTSAAKPFGIGGGLSDLYFFGGNSL